MDYEILKHIPNPEPSTERARAIARARDNMIPPNQLMCPHPVSAVRQFVDEEAGRADRPTNLFQCEVCKAMLFLVDGTGKDAIDG